MLNRLRRCGVQFVLILTHCSFLDYPVLLSYSDTPPDIDVTSGMVLPIVRCLRHMVHHNPATRETLAANTELYASLLRIVG